ncbi:hypothetical protein C5167_016792 [Papaver somniferum]|nr:hypothetical protein C5167_016792 [Papaver somniferum]
MKGFFVNTLGDSFTLSLDSRGAFWFGNSFSTMIQFFFADLERGFLGSREKTRNGFVEYSGPYIYCSSRPRIRKIARCPWVEPRGVYQGHDDTVEYVQFFLQVFKSSAVWVLTHVLIEEQNCESLEVDFANKYIGGGAIGRGCVQVC